MVFLQKNFYFGSSHVVFVLFTNSSCLAGLSRYVVICLHFAALIFHRSLKLDD